MYTGNHTTLLCILFGFQQHLILQHMPVNMILEFLHLFQFSLWQQGLEHLQNINHYRIELSSFSRGKKTNKLSKIRMWEISEITTLHNFVHLIKVNQQHMWILLEPQTLLEVIKFHIFQFYDI